VNNRPHARLGGRLSLQCNFEVAKGRHAEVGAIAGEGDPVRMFTLLRGMAARLLVGATWLAASAAVALAMWLAPAAAQVHFDRPGGDYTSAVVRSGDPAVCATRCERDARCRAWAFSYPDGSAAAVCWLKSQVPPRVESNDSVSGVRGAGVIEPKRRAVEYSIDRNGGDYRDFELPSDPTGIACKTACEADAKCRAWTYLRPGYGSAAAHCFLKDKVKPPRRRPCCISGVVR
jgi:hypothetical protein